MPENSGPGDSEERYSYVDGTVRSAETAAPETPSSQPRTWNAPIVLMVALPLLWLAFNATIGLADGLRWSTILTTLALCALVSVIVGRVDLRRAAASGFPLTISAWWGLVPIVYLARRGNRLWRGDFWSYRPMWAHIALLLVVVVLYLAAPLIITIISGLELSREMLGS